MSSLWGDEFVVESTKEKSKKILDKVGKPKQVKKAKNDKLSVEEKLMSIQENVTKILGHYADSTIVIKSLEEYNDYIDKCIQVGIVALDTETNNSLDPLTCKLMGLCLYSPSLPAAYIPVNHRNRFTNERLDWQLTEEQIADGIRRLAGTKIILHNAKFDYKVIKCTCGCTFKTEWDTQVAARVLDENEYSVKLKDQYVAKIDSNEEKYSIEHLFEGLEYAIVDPELFALYAATDSFKTYKLYEYQYNEAHKIENQGVLNLLRKVEFPVIEVVAEMELEGIALDKGYCDRLSAKYGKRLEELNQRIDSEMKRLQPEIDKWRMSPDANSYATRIVKGKEVQNKKTKSQQLENPPALTSPTQLAILLYDVLKAPIVDKNNPRGTGEEVLEQLSSIPLVAMIMEQRTLLKLIDAFIDSLPTLVSPKDNRVHASFNQVGTKTGRFSCSEPNLQQIPAKNTEVRMMFCAGPGKILVGSDYSQQEPRTLAALSGDRQLWSSYNEGKDLYATLGAGVYKNDYWDNMEHHEDGSENPEGKKRRKKMKTLLLAILYGMGPGTLAGNLGSSVEEAKDIMNSFHKAFPQASNWMKETERQACITGFVEGYEGRRRILPDLLLPEYTFKMLAKNAAFNPLIGSKGKTLDKALIEKYEKKLEHISFKDYDKVKKEAMAEGLDITKNGGFISRAKRQCVNAVIQGSAATMTKKAMIKIYHDPELRSYGFKLLIGVHDELIGECDEQYAEQASERLSYLMKTCVPDLDIPLKCDPTIEKHWYEEEYSMNIRKEFKSGMTFEEIVEKHSECTEEQLKSYLQTA